MFVVGSRAIPREKRRYHKLGCIYERRINPLNRIEKHVDSVINTYSCSCSYCAGLRGDVRVLKKSIDYWEKKNRMKFIYRLDTDTLYISTEIGFWKMFTNRESGKYLLYHRNEYTKEMSFSEAIHGDFHRQSDVKATESLAKLVEYIAAHDRAKVIIMDDYRKLPRRSKKQKKYYRQAKNRARREAAKRLDSIFMALESQNPELKYAYREVIRG